MNDHEKALSRTNKYLQLLQDENSKSHELYMDLLETLESGRVDGKVTMADLLLTGFKELGYMCKSDLTSLDKKEPDLDENGNLLIHTKKYNKYAKYFDDLDKDKSKSESFYGKATKQGEDWCTIFFHWILFNTIGEKNTRIATNVKKRENHAAGVDFDYWYYQELPQSMAMLLDHKLVSIGDQAFFYSKSGLCHTGMVVAVFDNYVYVLEGNTNPQVGEQAKVVPEGKGVCLKKYSIDRIDIEFCRPSYRGISPASHGFDWQAVNKKIANLCNTLKAELEQILTPEELEEPEQTPEEIEQTKLQIFKNKLKVIKDILKIGPEYLEKCLREVKDAGVNFVSDAKDVVEKHL